MDIKSFHRRLMFSMLGLLISASTAATGQVKTNVPDPVAGAKPAIVERIKIHGTALEGNLEGNAVDRDVIVVPAAQLSPERSAGIPSSTRSTATRSAPNSGRRRFTCPQTIEGAFAQGAREMIVVLPDSKTVHNGSMYSSSITTGDFENFIARDVVAYIDAHYRTIAEPQQPRSGRPLDGRVRREPHRHEARGCLRQPVHHEPVLPVAARTRRPANPANEEALAAVKTPADSQKTPLRPARAAGRGRGLVAQSEEPAALSRSADRTAIHDAVLAKWAANAPLAFIDQYIPNLRQYRAIAIDVGRQGRSAGRCGQAARCARQLRHRERRSKSTRARTRATSRSASRSTCCRSSAGRCRSKRRSGKR